MAIPALTNLPPGVSLRDRTPSDHGPLFSLFVESTAPQFTGLPEDQVQPLLDMQFHARDQGWEAQFPHASRQIIESHGDFSGYCVIGEHDHFIHILYLGLLKTFQNQGIAAGLVRALSAHADQQNRPIHAHVASENPALGFWQHMGFLITGTAGPYLSIEKPPRKGP